MLANLIIYFSFHFVVSFYIICGSGSVVEPQPSKLVARVRFPSPAPFFINYFYFLKFCGIIYITVGNDSTILYC